VEIIDVRAVGVTGSHKPKMQVVIGTSKATEMILRLVFAGFFFVVLSHMNTCLSSF
jgi:hypothetical protein